MYDRVIRVSAKLRHDFTPELTGWDIAAVSVGPSDDAIFLSDRPFNRILRWKDGQAAITELNHVVTYHNVVQSIPSGGFQLIGSRAEFRNGWRSDNVVRYDASGQLVAKMPAGDAIEHALVDSAGRTWIGYFDEGTTGDDEKFSTQGLVVLEQDGNIAFAFNRSRGPTVPDVFDCYALNVDGDQAWCYYYTEFPVVRISASFEVTVWTTNHAGAHALATDGSRVLLVGHYEDARPMASMGKLGDGELTDVVGVELYMNDRPIEYRSTTMVGRGPILHIFDGPRWYTVDVREIG